ncbi:MAG: hypothetical protein AVDCRST_MAG88-2083, partial [uncultured Thermomicrobiales bacterium]
VVEARAGCCRGAGDGGGGGRTAHGQATGAARDHFGTRGRGAPRGKPGNGHFLGQERQVRRLPVRDRRHLPLRPAGTTRLYQSLTHSAAQRRARARGAGTGI